MEKKEKKEKVVDAKDAKIVTPKKSKKGIISIVFVLIILGIGWWQFGAVKRATVSTYAVVTDVMTKTWTYVSFTSADVKEVDGVGIVTRKSLDENLIPMTTALSSWGKENYSAKYVVFGGSLVRSEGGELLWLSDGNYISVGAIEARFSGPGLWIVNNPNLEAIPGSYVTNGHMSVFHPRRLGFLWKKNSVKVLVNDFRGEFYGPEDFNFKFVASSKYDASRYKSELTPMIK